MKNTRLRIGIVTILLFVIATIAIVPIEAKYDITKYQHRVTVYETSDIPSNLRPYIAGLEYDRVYDAGYGYGGRLYFSTYGKATLKSPLYVSALRDVTNFIINNPEWYGGRSYLSVSTEIQYHAMWPARWQVDMEYYCSELKWWEQPYKSYC